MEVGGNVLRATGTVGAHEELAADVSALVGPGQGTVGGLDQGDVVISVVCPGVTSAHQQCQRFTTQAGAVVGEGAQGVEAVTLLVRRCGIFLGGVDVDQGSINIDDQRIVPGSTGCGVEVTESFPGAGADGAHCCGQCGVSTLSADSAS